MNRLMLVIITATLVTVADATIKKLSQMPQQPWELWLLVAVLYCLQCRCAYLIFKLKGDLGIQACLFVAFYSVFACLIGRFYFGEVISARQYVGIVLSLAGAFLLAF